MAAIIKIMGLVGAHVLAIYAVWVMMTYLTDVWKLNFTHAAAIVNIFTGAATMMPIGMACIVDAFMGDYFMLLLSSVAYSFGLSFLAMSTPPVLSKAAGNCSAYQPDCIANTQKVLFYTALALIAVGFSGHTTSLKPFLAFQKKDQAQNDRIDLERNLYCKFLGIFTVVIFALIGGIALPYIKPWSVRFGIPAICTVVATLVFLSGSSSYKHNRPQSKLCIETEEVEENSTKITVHMIPMWMAFIMCGIVISIGNTYFLEQANHMNRMVGCLKVPLPIFLIFHEMAKSIFTNRRRTQKRSLSTKLARTLIGEESKKYAPLVGFVLAMIISILCCITAAKVETRRLNVIKSHGLLDKPNEKIPMSIFWLLPQFLLLGALDGISQDSITCLFTRRDPLPKDRYPLVFTYGIHGAGILCSVVSVSIAGKISERGGKPSWFQDTLNKSRLDKYYWMLAVLSSINLVLFIFVAIWYTHQESEREERRDVQ